MTEREPQDPHGEASHEEWLRRREALTERLAAQQARHGTQAGASAGGTMRGAAAGMRLASEFVAGVLAGAGIGYLFDRLVGTQPFGLIVFLLFGFVAGVLNVLRSIGKPAGAPADPPEPRERPENPPSQ